MAKSKLEGKVSALFVGESANGVTGSSVLINFNNTNILCDYGLWQEGRGNKKTFSTNSKVEKGLNFKSSVDFIILSHPHIDHIGKIPVAIANGYGNHIYVPKNSIEIIKILLLNSFAIVFKEAEQYALPIPYTKEDVYKAVSLMRELDYNKKIKLNNEVEIEMFKNSHTIGSAQTMLYFNDGLHKKSVLYTGDIGSNWYFHSPFVEKTEYIKKANMVISEATYGLKDSPTDKDDRLKDREKLKRYILETMESGGSMLIPSFSFSRTQELLWEIYNIFKDEKFPYSVIIDSKLSVDLTTLYPKILDKEKRLKMEEALKWENLFLVSEHKTHEMLKKSNKPKVIISSSGFLVEKTRSHSHLLELLPNKNGRICFVGYTGDENSLGHKLKNNKSITYKGEKYTIKSDIVNLSSFSSHIQYKELLWYLSEINSEKVIIHHSDKSAKESFVKDLQEEINKKNKTSKVLISNKDSKISI